MHLDAVVVMKGAEVTHVEEPRHLPLELDNFRLVCPDHDEVININSDK